MPVDNIIRIVPKAVTSLDTMLGKMSDTAVLGEVLKNRFLLMDISRKLDIVIEMMNATKH